MKYLSTFSGVGGFELAIHDVFKKAECVGFSEIDKYAIQTYLKNFPHKDLNFGDIERLVYDVVKNRKIVNEYRINLLPNFDLLVSGFPCQDLSIANDKRKGLDGTKSGLFFACLEIIRIKKPKWFLFENVASMSKVNRDKISKLLGVEPVEICVDRFTPQKRKRLYWFNWVFDISKLPEKGERWPFLMAWSSSNDYHKNGEHKKRRQRETRDGRANTLTTGKGCGNYSSMNYIDPGGVFEKRILTPLECEQLQGLPIDYTKTLRIKNYNTGDLWKNVLQKNVSKNLKLKNMGNYVSCIIKDLKNEELLRNIKRFQNILLAKNVHIAIERLNPEKAGQEICAPNIIKTGIDITTLCTQIKLENPLAVEGMKKELTVLINTELLLKITLKENCKKTKLFIILIAIKLITELKIFTFVKTKVSIQFCIKNLKIYPENSLSLDILNFQTETTESLMSNSQRYKQIGNSVNPDSVKAILMQNPDFKLGLK